MSIHIIGIADPRSPAQVRDLIKAGTNEVFSRPVAPIHVVRAFLSKGVKSSLSYGDIEMDIQAQRVWRRTFAIALPRIEFAILHQLLLCPERILNRREIISRSWPSGVFVDPKTVNVHIGNLRRLLMVGGLANPIRSVRGAGYGMELPTELGKNPQVPPDG